MGSDGVILFIDSIWFKKVENTVARLLHNSCRLVADSNLQCHMLPFFSLFFSLNKLLELIGRGSVFNDAYLV